MGFDHGEVKAEAGALFPLANGGGQPRTVSFPVQPLDLRLLLMSSPTSPSDRPASDTCRQNRSAGAGVSHCPEVVHSPQRMSGSTDTYHF